MRHKNHNMFFVFTKVIFADKIMNTDKNISNWKRGRVVEGSSLENCSTGNGTRGSNPLASAQV